MDPTRMREEAANEMWPVATIVIYDDDESGCRAKALLDQVAATAGGEIQFSLALWQMARLAHPFNDSEFLRDLGRSFLLVLALGAGGELRQSVFDWVACWASCRAGSQSALVVLGNVNAIAATELRQIAERHGIRLFSQQATQPGSEWQNYLQGLPKREEVPGPTSGDILPHPHFESYRDWGLNE